jgi:hypothetical protein
MEARVRSQVRRAALRHLSAARREGRWRDLEGWALQVLRHDALNEEATLALAESMVMQGSKARALELLDGYLGELGEKADRIGLPAKVLRKRIVGGGAPGNSGPQSVPVIGREAILATLTTFTKNSKATGPRSIHLQGPAGAGKSRLAEEASQIASLEGYSIRWLGQQGSAPTTLSFSVLAGALSRLSEGLAGAAAADPVAMSTIRRTFHDGQEEPSPLSASDNIDHTAFSRALAQVLIAAADEAPVCLVIEDTHLLLSTDIQLLNILLAQTEHARILWILTGRPVQSRQSQDSVAAKRVLRVGRLDPEATKALATAFCQHNALPWSGDRLVAVAAMSGGNPLLLQTLLLQPAYEAATRPHKELSQALSSYLHTLPPDSLRLLEAVALLQPFADVPRVVSACHVSVSEALTHLTPLIDSGILRDSTCELSVHDAWAEALFDQKSPAEIAALSLICAHALFTEASRSSNPAAIAHSAALFRRGGDISSAHSALCSAASLLSGRGDHKGAYSLLTSAHSLAPDGPTGKALLPRLATAAYLTADLSAAERFGALYVSDTDDRTESDANHALSCLAIAADSQWKLNKPFSLHLEKLLRALTTGSGRLTEYSTACLFAMRLALTISDDTLATRIHSLQCEHTARHGDCLIACLVSLIYFAERGDQLRLLGTLDRSRILQAAPQQDHVQCLALRYRMIALRYLGRQHDALELAEEGKCLAERAGLTSEAFQFAISAAFTLLDEANISGAERWLDSAEHLKNFIGSPERERALLYGMARLDCLRGQYQKAREKYTSFEAIWATDTMPRRKALEMATYALSLARTGDTTESKNVALVALKIVAATASTQQLDAAVEHLLETFALVSRSADIAPSVAAYLRARNASGKRYIPSAFPRLRESALHL